MNLPSIDAPAHLAVHAQLLLGKHGEELLTVVKATYLLPRDEDELVIADQGRPVRFIDEHWDDPATSAPKYPGDICGVKPSTDVVFVAKGYAPESRSVKSFDVLVRVGTLSRMLRIHGLRVWTEGGSGLSAPRPLSEQEIRYDLAWGGLDVSDPAEPVGELRNPVGRGVVRDKRTLTHEQAPCIEDPKEPIMSASARLTPVGIGPIGPHWKPRRDRVGTYDDAWLREQAPLLPHDFDERANQCASPGLIASPPLRGNEMVELAGLTPGGGAVRFALPSMSVSIDDSVPPLDTVIVDTLHVPDDCTAVVELVWRSLTPAALPLQQTTVVVRVN
jgi:hypothetical protein